MLIPLQLSAPAEVTVIRVQDPDWSLCDVLRWLGPPADTVPPGVHPSAIVDPSAQVSGAAIGPHAVVGPHCVVNAGTQLHTGVVLGSHVRIGRECILWPNVVVREHCRLGDRVIIQANASIGSDGFGYLWRDEQHIKVPQVGIVVIEDDVEIGSGTCVDRAKSGVTRIGRGTKIDNLVQIGHNNEIGEKCLIIAQVGIAGSCQVGPGAVLCGQVGLIDHLTIGPGAVLTSQAGAIADVPAHTTVGGMPAVEQRAFLRQHVAVRKLPDLLEQVRDLVRRIERIEQAAHD